MLVERYNPKYTRNMKVAENYEYQLNEHNDDFYKARKKPYVNPQFSNANEFISLHEYTFSYVKMHSRKMIWEGLKPIQGPYSPSITSFKRKMEDLNWIATTKAYFLDKR